jgi:hypothetical protein
MDEDEEVNIFVNWKYEKNSSEYDQLGISH